MWQELMVKERIKTALKEGITSQTLSREKRCDCKQHSLLYKVLQMICQTRHEESGEDRIAVILSK